MAAQIEIRGQVASFDGQSWTAEDRDLQELCRLTADALPPGYSPDPIGDVAAEVAAQLGGRVVQSDPAPGEEAAEDVIHEAPRRRAVTF